MFLFEEKRKKTKQKEDKEDTVFLVIADFLALSVTECKS